MLKGLLKTIKISVAICIVAMIAMPAAAQNKATAEKPCCEKFAASSPDSLLPQDLLWLNRYVLPTENYGQISDIKPLLVDDKMPNKFINKYVFFITQPIDHKNPKKGTFKQMVVVAFAGWDKPTEIVTEGYTGTYFLNPRYREEMSDMFSTNMIGVEHRYFNKSVPFMQNDSTITWDTLDWSYMTAEQEAADLHAIRKALGHLFQGKWFSSGISKGGTNCMAYTAFYPKDLDFSVPYVGPISRSVEDGRHEPFIRDSCGTAQDREILKKFQIEFLKRRATIQPMLEKYVRDNKLQYKISIPELYDYCTLEFTFAFWQWGRKTSTVPNPKTAKDKEMFDFFVEAVGPDYFQSWDANAPFFVQAAKEMGYYGYDCEPFKDLLTIKSTHGYLQKIFLPAQKFKFDKSLYNKLTAFIATTDAKMMLIYGQWDPWSSVRPHNPGHDNIKFFILPGGSHRSRIKNMPEPMRSEAVATLKQWLDAK